MRLRLRWILCGILLGCVARCYFAPWRQIAGDIYTDLAHRRIADDAMRYRTIALPLEGWVQYQISPRADAVRVFTNAAVSQVEGPMVASRDDDPRPGHRYAIAYQILDRRGQVLREGTYHFRATVIQYETPGSGELFRVAFFERTPWIPAITRTMHLPLGELAGVADRLRLRALEFDSTVAEVVARVYGRQERDDYRDPFAWSRISAQMKEKLTRASVYPPELMGPYERRNLLRWRWTVASPIGREQTRQRRRTLYVENRTEGQEYHPHEIPQGLLVTPDLRGMVALPPALGHVDIEWLALPKASPMAPEQAEAGVAVRWHGPTPNQRRTSTQRVMVGHDRTRLDAVEGGQLEIATTAPVVARVWWQADAGSLPPIAGDTAPSTPSDRPEVLDLTPEPTYLRSYIVEPEFPVVFDLTPLPSPEDGGPAIECQVQLRIPSDASPFGDAVDDIEPVDVRWTALDREGLVIDSGIQTVRPTWSRYDSISNGGERGKVSEATRLSFQFGAHVNSLRVASLRGNVLVAGFTRPPRAIRTLRVPEDYQDWQAHASPERTWFYVKAREHAVRFEQNRTQVCRLQPRPPEPKPFLAEGMFTWEAFFPDGPWVARPLLVPRQSQLPIRERAAPSLFFPVPADQATTWKFASGLGMWEPTLIYRQTDTKTPGEIRLSLAGAPPLVRTLPYRAGRIPLPRQDTRADRQTLRLEAPLSVDAWLNGRAVTPDDDDVDSARLLRTALVLENAPLEFVIVKRQPEETLSLTLFRGDPLEEVSLLVEVAPATGNLARPPGFSSLHTYPSSVLVFRETRGLADPRAGGRSPQRGTQGRQRSYPCTKTCPPGRTASVFNAKPRHQREPPIT